jgi:hypothetical protein
METSSLILLLVSASISFAVGRVIVYFRKRNTQRKAQRKTFEQQAQAQRDRVLEPVAKNKAKRKRQLQELGKLPPKNSP